MKKMLAVVMVLAMILAFGVTASAAGGKLTLDQAKQAALNYAQVDASQATFTKAKTDWDDGREIYEIEFYADGTEYDMDVDALTGRITDFSTEYHGPSGGSVGGFTGGNAGGTVGGKLTLDQAKQAALDYAQVDASAATFTKTKTDWDDGREVYEIEFYADGTEYEMHVDALTGKITDFGAEYHDTYGGSSGSVAVHRRHSDDWGSYETTTLMVGGWTAAQDPTVTPEHEQLLETALQGYKTGKIAVTYTPVAYLGSQVVAGTNLAFLCKADAANGYSSWVIAYLYKDLQGNVTLMNIADFDFGSLCTYGAY